MRCASWKRVFRPSARCEGRTIELPLNQEDFADILGISVIHVNRTFRRLSEDKTAEYRKGSIDWLDRDRLAEISAFDPSYLHLGKLAL